MSVWWWSNVANGGPPSNRHWVDVCCQPDMVFRPWTGHNSCAHKVSILPRPQIERPTWTAQLCQISRFAFFTAKLLGTVIQDWSSSGHPGLVKYIAVSYAWSMSSQLRTADVKTETALCHSFKKNSKYELNQNTSLEIENMWWPYDVMLRTLWYGSAQEIS